MPKGQDLSRYQQKIVKRYYEHRGSIHLVKLQELVSEIVLTDAGAKREKLWKSARDFLAKSGVEPTKIARACDANDPAALAVLVGELSK